MAVIIKPRGSAVSGTVPVSLQQGELAINRADGRIWVGTTNNTVVELTGSGPAGAPTAGSPGPTGNIGPPGPVGASVKGPTGANSSVMPGPIYGGVVRPNPYIMCLGDSITAGEINNSLTGSYRVNLDALLQANGVHPTWVGSQVDFFGFANEGHPGNTIEQINSNVQGYINAQIDTTVPRTVQVVVLMIGSNNVPGASGAESVNAAVTSLTTLITNICSNYSWINVLLCTIPPQNDATRESWITQFNGQLQGVVSSLVTNHGYSVFLADVFDYIQNADLSDGVHPLQEGYNKIANALLHPLVSILSTRVGAIQLYNESAILSNAQVQSFATGFQEWVDENVGVTWGPFINSTMRPQPKITFNINKDAPAGTWIMHVDDDTILQPWVSFHHNDAGSGFTPYGNVYVNTINQDFPNSPTLWQYGAAVAMLGMMINPGAFDNPGAFTSPVGGTFYVVEPGMPVDYIHTPFTGAKTGITIEAPDYTFPYYWGLGPNTGSSDWLNDLSGAQAPNKVSTGFLFSFDGASFHQIGTPPSGWFG